MSEMPFCTTWIWVHITEPNRSMLSGSMQGKQPVPDLGNFKKES